MQGKLRINPWIQIWTSPRQTIRTIVSFDPKYRFWLLSSIYGFPMLLHLMQNFSLGQTTNLYMILILALVLAPFVGALGIMVASGLMMWTGRWIGGKAGFYPIRTAVAWSNVPNLVGIVLWLILVVVFGKELFTEDFHQSAFAGRELFTVSTIFLLQTVVAIWSFVILLKGLGEVQGFSIWKSLLNVLIPFFMIGILIWLLSWLVWVAQGMPVIA
ncbi:MAG: YIP1 family protein [Chlamydiae bacterium]|nr:YIP1 family protein [Chlamydiota bacterium]